MGCKNILLITSDQQHYNTIGINNPEIETPNLDRLARQGERLNDTNPPDFSIAISNIEC